MSYVNKINLDGTSLDIKAKMAINDINSTPITSYLKQGDVINNQLVLYDGEGQISSTISLPSGKFYIAEFIYLVDEAGAAHGSFGEAEISENLKNGYGSIFLGSMIEVENETRTEISAPSTYNEFKNICKNYPVFATLGNTNIVSGMTYGPISQLGPIGVGYAYRDQHTTNIINNSNSLTPIRFTIQDAAVRIELNSVPEYPTFPHTVTTLSGSGSGSSSTETKLFLLDGGYGQSGWFNFSASAPTDWTSFEIELKRGLKPVGTLYESVLYQKYYRINPTVEIWEINGYQDSFETFDALLDSGYVQATSSISFTTYISNLMFQTSNSLQKVKVQLQCYAVSSDSITVLNPGTYTTSSVSVIGG